MTGDLRWALALGGWTVFVWISRIRNVLSDDELDGFAQWWRLGVAFAFVVAGGAVLVSWLLGRSRHHGPMTFPSAAGWRLAAALAVVGSAWWAIRGVAILLGEWDTGFKIVHTLLAVVTIALSALVLRSRSELVERR